MKIEFKNETCEGYGTIDDCPDYTEFHLYLMTCDSDLVDTIKNFMEELKDESN